MVKLQPKWRSNMAKSKKTKKNKSSKTSSQTQVKRKKSPSNKEGLEWGGLKKVKFDSSSLLKLDAFAFVMIF